MRIFEAVLIFINLLTLALSGKRQAKVTCLAALGVNLVVCFIHGLFEGFRYQMIFSYTFVFLLAAYLLLQKNTRFSEAKISKALKFIAISISLLLLTFSAFLAYALPVFMLPQPTGSYDVGIQYFHLVDENRTEPFLNGTTQNRELMVKIYYPAESDSSKPYSHYFHDSPELIRLLIAGYGMPDFLFDHLNLVMTHTKDGLPLSDQEQVYPVILFSHGGGTSMEVHTSQSEDLASHGYIVVAIDHPYVSAATIFPNRTVSAREATTDFNTGDPVVVITQIMADDATFVIDTLGELNNGTIESPFTERLNLDAIGIAGHSLGGAVAYNLAINDTRIRAAVNLDGVVYGAPEAGTETIAPFLMLANDKFYIQAIQNQDNLLLAFDEMTDVEQEQTLWMYGSREGYDEVYNEATQNMIGLAKVVQASGNVFTIEGSDHMKFSDIGLFFGDAQVRELMNISGVTDPARCLEITKALTLVFFDQHLKDEAANSFESLLDTYPELRKIIVSDTFGN